MKKYDLLIYNGRLVFSNSIIEGGVAVNDGKIHKIFQRKEGLIGLKEIDAEGKYILPGLIDSHVHFRTPGLTHKETWLTGSKAAVAGGITTVLDMPNTNPYLSSLDLLEKKEKLVQGETLVDYGFHFGVEPGKSFNLNLIDSYTVASIKLFLTGHQTAKNIISEFTDLDDIFRIAAEKDILLTFHAEDEETLNLFRKVRQAPNNLIEYEKQLPRTAAIIAIGRILEFIRKYGTSVHILHVSSAEEVELLELSSRAGYPISFETTPHQLWFDMNGNVELGSRIKLSPAIRTKEDQLSLWKSLMKGHVKSIGSDHAPHTENEKKQDFKDCPPGLPGVQEMLPVLITGLRNNFPEISNDEVMSKVACLLGSGPADLFRINHLKGRIKVGLDADLVIVDLETKWHVKKDNLYGLCQWSPYEGEVLIGKPSITIRRGEIVYDNGEFGEPNGKKLTYNVDENLTKKSVVTKIIP